MSFVRRLIYRAGFWSLVAVIMLLSTVLPDQTMINTVSALGVLTVAEALIRWDDAARAKLTDPGAAFREPTR